MDSSNDSPASSDFFLRFVKSSVSEDAPFLAIDHTKARGRSDFGEEVEGLGPLKPLFEEMEEGASNTSGGEEERYVGRFCPFWALLGRFQKYA